MLQLLHMYSTISSVFYNIYCEHLGSHNAFLQKKSMKSWICFLWGPDDDPVKVETCRPDNILF